MSAPVSIPYEDWKNMADSNAAQAKRIIELEAQLYANTDALQANALYMLAQAARIAELETTLTNLLNAWKKK